jgi:prolyl oligopeptidase
MRNGLAVVCAMAILLAPASAQPASLTYPTARRDSVVDTYFGTLVADPYRWMEDLNSPEVRRWVEAENALTLKYLGLRALRNEFRRRITELWNRPRVSTPHYEGGRWFYRRNSGLQQQDVVYARGSLSGPETIVLDPNAWSLRGSIALSGFSPSPDGTHFAYGQAEGGSDWSTYHVRRLAGGEQLPDTISWVKFSSIDWTKDGKGFFYGRYPEPPAGQALQAPSHDKRLYYHVLGTPQSVDRLVYERPAEPALFIGSEIDETGRYLFIETSKGSGNKNELFVKDLGDPRSPHIDAPAVPLYEGHTASYDPLGVVGGLLYLLTNRDAPNGKLVAVPIDRPDVANWKTIVPEGKNAIQGARLVAGRVAVNALEDVASVVRFYRLDGAAGVTIAPPGLGVISGPAGRFDRPEVFYVFESPLYPRTVFRFDPATGRSEPFEPSKRTFDPSLYETERVFFTSKDGTRVPMFITHKKSLKRDGRNSTMLYGYGGFDVPVLPGFASHVLAWLERGGVWATANIRGGSEYGKAWHEAGMREKKQNVFDDFIAAAEFLIGEHYTAPHALGIVGGSNGGLLVGAVMEQRPDLFAVALPDVGVMDMLRYHKFTDGAAWVEEYGSSDDPAFFPHLLKYSPLHNIKSGTCYPATLVTTADHDDRVVPSHSFKFTAALQAAQGCDRPVLIRVETEASHGYSPTDKRISTLADMWTFAATNVRLTGSR